MKKTFSKILVLGLLSLASCQLLAQVKLTSANKFQIGYGTYTPILLGNGYAPVQGTNNGKWGIEYWDNAVSSGVGGLNFWIPFPQTGAQNNALFLRDGNGYVGIGRLPSYILDVNGQIRVQGTIIGSDARLKTNIKPLNLSLNNLRKLNGKVYNKINVPYTVFKDSLTDELKIKTIQQQEADKTKYLKSETEFGLLAQELNTVYPELVSTDESGIMSINYIGLIPVLIESIKEQQLQIDDLTKRLNGTTGSTLGKTSLLPKANENKVSEHQLLQNIPNPFTQTTEITCVLADGVTNAMINIYDLQGTEIKSFGLRGNGKQTITVQGTEFRAGMYYYTLIVNGQEVDTKRMILTK
jgi:hypothetical protein